MRHSQQAFVGFSLSMAVLLMLLVGLLPSLPRIIQTEETCKIHLPHSSNLFIKENFTQEIEGPTVHPVASQIKWLEDLSWVEPPLCDGTEPFILAMVISAVGNFEQRARVRNTWAAPTFFQYTGIKAVFVVGWTGNDTLQEALVEEMQTYEDIIQNDFVDSYRNLTYKTISLLSWVKDFCPETPFIAKIDDDVIVNPFNLWLYLHQHLVENPSPKSIHGRGRFKSHPSRDSKWAVTEEEYSENRYPPFVLGSAYILDRNAVDVLLAYIPYVPMLWLEDVYLTGLVAQRAGIHIKQVEKKLYTSKFTRKLYCGSVAFFINPKKNHFKMAWLKILKYSNKVISKMKSKHKLQNTKINLPGDGRMQVKLRKQFSEGSFHLSPNRKTGA